MYHAYQTPPEWQESPFDFFGMESWPGVIITGNRHFKDYTTPEFDFVVRYLDEMTSDWINGVYTTIRELLSDYRAEAPSGKPWTTKERHAWKEIFTSESMKEDDAICAALELMTGEPYETGYIRGCCQSDWQGVYYPAEMADEMRTLETEYFNTGTEYRVCEGEDDEESDSFTVYCYEWSEEGQRAEIAAAIPTTPENVVLHEFTGYTKTPKWA